MILFRQYFRVQRSGLLIWVGINSFLGWALGASVEDMETASALSSFIAKAMERLPSAVRALLGMAPEVSAIDNFIQAKIGFWMAIALPIYGCLMAVAAVSREIDRGTADFLFALPVERQEVILARWSVMVVNLTTVVIATWGSLCVGLSMGGVAGNFRGYFWMISQAGCVGIAIGSLALLASMWAPDYERAIKRALLGVGILFFADIAMEFLSVPRFTRALNPYSYFDTVQPLLRGGPVWEDVAPLAAMSLLALWLSMRTFRTRQIEA